jgi:hypothetical protein
MQMIHSTKPLGFSGVITATVIAGSLFALASTSTYAATTNVHSASSYGAEVKVGSVVKLGPIAVAQLGGCTTQPIGNFTASAASVSEAGLLTAGNVDSVASSTANSSTGSSEVTNVSLLGGIISTTDIKAVSTSSVAGSLFTFSATGSTFADLTVLGIPIAANVAPNTVIDLPLLGTVTLNEQERATSFDKAELLVNMIHVRITAGVNKGAQIIVASAFSEIRSRSVPAAVGGYAYAPKLEVGPVTTGPLVLEVIPCFGTNGVVETDSVAATSIPGLVTTGTVTVTGEGNVARLETESEATSSIAGVNVLAGLVGATAITANAKATTTDGVTFDFTGGSTFVGLKVAGFPTINDSVAPNTKIAIANLGDLYFNRIEIDADRIKVVPIELVIKATNSLGLPIGADLTLGVVEAQLHSTEIP